MSKRCPKCGNQFAAFARFCPLDGTALLKEHPDTKGDAKVRYRADEQERRERKRRRFWVIAASGTGAVGIVIGLYGGLLNYASITDTSMNFMRDGSSVTAKNPATERKASTTLQASAVSLPYDRQTQHGLKEPVNTKTSDENLCLAGKCENQVTQKPANRLELSKENENTDVTLFSTDTALPSFVDGELSEDCCQQQGEFDWLSQTAPAVYAVNAPESDDDAGPDVVLPAVPRDGEVEALTEFRDQNPPQSDLERADSVNGDRTPQRRLVKNIQTELTRLQYGPGPVDGVVGPQTAGAIRNYQAEEMLPVDGKPSHELLRRLQFQRTSGTTKASKPFAPVSPVARTMSKTVERVLGRKPDWQPTDPDLFSH